MTSPIMPKMPALPPIPNALPPTPQQAPTKPAAETQTPAELIAPERIHAKPITGSPITQPAMQIIHGTNIPHPPPPPLTTRSLNPAPLNMEQFKARIESSGAKNDAEIQAHKKDVADVKTKKIALKTLAVVGTLTLMTATVVTCVLFPPAGVAVLALGLGVGAAVGGAGIGIAYGTAKAKLTPNELQTLEQREEILGKALKLFEDHPKNVNSPNGKSFEEFLAKCHSEGLGGPELEIDKLKDYISIYEKQQKLDKMNTDVAQLNDGLNKDVADLKELNVIPDHAQAPQDAETTKTIQTLEKEISQKMDELKDLGVKDPQNPQSIKDTIADLEKKQLGLIQQRNETKPRNGDQINSDIAANKTLLTSLKETAQTLNAKQGALQAIERPVSTISQEIERLKTADPENPKLAQLEGLSQNITLKQEKLEKLLNPFKSEIEKREGLIQAEIGKIKELKDATENPVIETPENLPAIRQKIEDLKARNEQLQAAVHSTPATDDAAGIKLKEESTKEFTANNQLINDLQTSLKTIDKLHKEIDGFNDRITPTAEEIETDKQILKRDITKTEYFGDDIRTNSKSLADWKSKPIEGLSQPVSFGPGNKDDAIGIFGTYNTRPRGGIYRENVYDGVPISHSEQDYKDMGRSNKNNFLSNFYNKGEVSIEGKTYPTSMHYLLSKKIANDRAALEEARDKGTDLLAISKLRRLQILEQSIAKQKSPEAAYALAMYEGRDKGKQTQSLDIRNGLFGGIDDSLKTVLYHKFVGPDGTPTPEGDMLLKTGHKTLYAGNEHGEDMYLGMQFTKKGEMVGENRLGIALMELRDMMRKSGANPLP